MPDRPDRTRLVSALAWAVASPAPAPGLRARILASSRGSGRYGVFADRIARLFDLTLARARDLLADLERSPRWIPTPSRGLELVAVSAGPRCQGALTTFVRMAPGASFQLHRHVEEELTFVLDGGFHDTAGADVARGEELYKAPGTQHAFTVHGDRPCVAATVAFGGIELLGHDDGATRGEPGA